MKCTLLVCLIEYFVSLLVSLLEGVLAPVESSSTRQFLGCDIDFVVKLRHCMPSCGFSMSDTTRSFAMGGTGQPMAGILVCLYKFCKRRLHQFGRFIIGSSH